MTDYPQTRIFCTFVDDFNLEPTIRRLLEIHPGIRIFILLIPEEERFVISYSLSREAGLPKFLENTTISVHRKKGFNVLYTINALKEVIKKQNSGEYREGFPVDWTSYKDSILVTREGYLRQIKTRLFKILN